MVQQLTLTAQIPSKSVSRLLLTLKTLTGNIQSDMNVHTVILKPRYPFMPEQIAGKVVQIESYRVRMNRIWEKGHPTSLVHNNIHTDVTILGDSITRRDNESLNSSIWTLQLSDIPAGGQNPVLIQNIYETTIYQTDDIIGYLDELGYIHETEFWTYGTRFYYGNVIIEITQIYVNDTAAVRDLEAEFSNKDITLTTLKLLDPSRSYHIKAYVNVSSLNDLESVAVGVKSLEALKKELSELVELKIPDRLAMDSRINSRIAQR